MALVKSLRLLAVVSLAILNISFEALPANALNVDRGHIGRSPNHLHAGIAKKRDGAKCKPRATSAPTSSYSDHAAVATPTSYMTTTSSHPTTSTTPSSGSAKPGLAWSNPEQQSLHNFITKDTK